MTTPDCTLPADKKCPYDVWGTGEDCIETCRYLRESPTPDNLAQRLAEAVTKRGGEGYTHEALYVCDFCGARVRERTMPLLCESVRRKGMKGCQDSNCQGVMDEAPDLASLGIEPKPDAENLAWLEAWLDVASWRMVHFQEGGKHFVHWVDTDPKHTEINQDRYSDGSYARTVSTHRKSGHVTNSHKSSVEQTARIEAALEAENKEVGE